MDQLLRQLRLYLRGMWLYRWYGMAATWVVALGGVAYVALIPTRYEASARVYVDTQSILRPLMSGMAVQPNVDQQVALLSRTLLSRPNLEKLARMADLDLGSKSRAETDALVDSLAQRVQIRNTGRDNLYTLSFTDTDRGKAQQMVQSLVNVFVESGLGRTKKDTESAKRFIEEQIKSFEVKLTEAEQRRKEFRIRNLDVQNADGRDATARVAQVATQLDQARLELREAENARDSIKRQLADLRSNTTSATQSLLMESAVNVSTPELDSRIDSLQSQIDGLMQRFTEAHPDVVNGRRLLQDLKEQRRKRVEELRRAALANPVGAGGPGLSATEQELNRLLANAEIQFATVTARVAEYNARLGQARGALRTNPELDAQSVALDRDYAINKKAYEDFLARRQSADLSGDLDEAGSAEFRVIDPPRAANEPVSPKRQLLLGGALLASLAAGLGVAFLLAELRPVFHDGTQVAQITGLRLLGVVSATFDTAELRRVRRHHLWFMGAGGGLAGLYLLSAAAFQFILARAS